LAIWKLKGPAFAGNFQSIVLHKPCLPQPTDGEFHLPENGGFKEDD